MGELKTFKEIRESRGISKVHVAKVLGITPQSLTNKEKNKCDFSMNEADKLCTFYGVKFEEVRKH